MRTNSRGCLSCQTGRVARARPPARIPLDFRGFQWERAPGRGTTRRRRERRTTPGCQARGAERALRVILAAGAARRRHIGSGATTTVGSDEPRGAPDFATRRRDKDDVSL